MPSIEQYAVSVSESTIDLREIAIMLLADSTANEVQEPESEFHDFETRFNRSQEDVCDLFVCEMSGIDIETELKSVEESVERMILSVNSNLVGLTFEEMWKTDEKGARREILRCVGHGVSFWDDYDPQDFGQSDRPRVGYFESPYNEAYDCLVKLVNHERAH